MIDQCGGTINSYPPPNIPQNKTLVRVKCDARFDRESVDSQITMWSKKKKAPNLISNFYDKDHMNLSNASKNYEDVAKNEEIDEILIDFHWVTDCVYTQEELPLQIYSMDSNKFYIPKKD